jgi:hypothetical protein
LEFKQYINELPLWFKSTYAKLGVKKPKTLHFQLCEWVVVEKKRKMKITIISWEFENLGGW